ncbi:MAG TPA: MerR family DNA-binding transcriptional regulator [Pyrinomonadaceae bacterium]|jgi:DNA-binding transcriptional MerR regulator
MEEGLTANGFLRSGEVARLSGVSTDTLRHYEEKKVLPRPRRGANGYRLYPADTPGRVVLVQRALAVGFTLDELALILGERDKGGAPCRKVHKLTTEKLARVEEQIESLKELRSDLRKVLAMWQTRLAATDDGTQRRLLETLPPAKSRRPLKLTPNSKRRKESFK